MVLEATMIVIDNSEHARNGDYTPTRLEAQKDAANIIFSAKTNANPESSVGLMSMGASQPEVLTTLTTEAGKVIDGLHRTREAGTSHFGTALNVASLALKHRLNKSQHSRVIIFSCSPLVESERQLVQLAKRMKKNGIAVDVVLFGDLDGDRSAKMEKFHEAVKQAGGEGADDQSHLAILPADGNLLSDMIVASPILAGEGGGFGGAGAGAGQGGGDAGGQGGDGFGMEFDPSSDPELALALRMSMEEEEKRQREERERQSKAEGEKLETVPEDGEGKKDSEGGSGSGASGDKMDTS